jgi:nitrite reductase/ring-hydroxylating ferredoxin subunit
MREVDLGSGRALLIKEHGEFSAMGHKCPHYGAPLVKGESRSALFSFFVEYWYENSYFCCLIKF